MPSAEPPQPASSEPGLPLRLSVASRGLRVSIFSRLADRLRALPPDSLPMHIGDTWRQPPEPARLDRIDWGAAPPLYRYSHPHGLQGLLEALAAKVALRNRIPAGLDGIQVTCGATHALRCVAHALLDPGDEVLLLAPYWPLIPGVLASAGARVREVPLTPLLLEDPDLDVASVLEEARGPATRAVYFANPNNPDGKVYARGQLEGIARFCLRHGLAALADEVYEDHLFDGREHLSLASLPGMAARTATVFSFSKSYALAGHRLGYVVLPPAACAALRRVANHSVYNVSAALQWSALQALRHGEGFLVESRRLYQEARDALVAGLGGKARAPEGAGYVFLDCGSPEAAWDLWERALDRGVITAPGADFGPSFAHCLRICFTGVPLDGVARGGRLLGSLLGQGGA